MEIKKVVVKLNIHDDKDKQKAMKAVSSITGINIVEVDMKEGKMTVIGEIDPLCVVCKLKKQWKAQIITVGPHEEEKKEDKKEDDKKEEGQKIDEACNCKLAYPPPPPPPPPPPIYYCYGIIDECPNNFCTIC